jgi:adenylylsulfate kinase
MQKQRGETVWFTGLSGAGKSTIAQAVEFQLRQWGYGLEVLDGDIVRTNLTKGLGFSRADRDENIRRIGFVSHLLTRNGVIVLVSAISPYREIRGEVRDRIQDFVEIYVDAPLQVCEDRDVKGLYKRARAGEIKQFTGIDDPYEPPLNPEVHCHTDQESVEESVVKVLAKLESLGYIQLAATAAS